MRPLIGILFAIVMTSASTSKEADSRSRNLETLIKAEQDFAKISRETNTRNAFISAFATDGMIFPGSGERVNAIAHWQAVPDPKPEERDWLDWEPLYADVAQSGDLGYTTGPYVYKADRTDTATSHHGYFFSVWKKEKGIWKNWVDMGLGTPADPADTVEHFARHESYAHPSKSPVLSIADMEAKFVAEQNEKGLGVFEKYLGELCQINRPRMRPAFGPVEGMKSVLARSPKVKFQVVETKAAASGEFAVAYGTADITIADEAASNEFNGHYVRVWKVYKGEWKIDVDVMIAVPKM